LIFLKKDINSKDFIDQFVNLTKKELRKKLILKKQAKYDLKDKIAIHFYYLLETYYNLLEFIIYIM
jgi:hypothetical protein